MNKKHAKENQEIPHSIPIIKQPDEKLEKLEKDFLKLKNEFKHMQKSFQDKEFDIYSRIIERETDIFRLEYKVHDLKMAIIALCITLIGYFVINIIKIVWSK